MGKQIQTITATVISMLSLVITLKTPKVDAAVLFVGKYGFLNQKLMLISLIQRQQVLGSLLQGNKTLISVTEQSSNSLVQKQFAATAKDSELQQSLSKSVNNLQSAEKLNEQIKDYSPTFVDKPLSSQLSKAAGTSKADKINQDIQERTQGLVEGDDEISLVEAQKILKSTDNEIGAEFNAGDLDNIDKEPLEQTVAVLQSQGVAGNILDVDNGSVDFPKPIFLVILLLTSSPIILMFVALGVSFTEAINEGFLDDLKDKFGKPKVPEGSVFLHNRSFTKISDIALKAVKINDEKFGTEEFLFYVKIKHNIRKGGEEYQQLNNRVELLRAAILAQKSFLRLEQTELRYRSRKQQEFYRFVADNISDSSDNIDKQAFNNKVKKKQAEILPLITTEEGRAALDSYVKEINVISQYDLGLKLLALFKQYELADFSILKTVSDIVETLQAKDLLTAKNLVSLVIENYEVFEKLSPILSISKAESSPAVYARILQIIGLIERHADAYIKFGQLVELLKKWDKLHQSIAMVRQAYTSDKYTIPQEFKEKIPGLNVYQKYGKYLTPCLRVPLSPRQS
jgi:hypothetical protein